MDQVEVDVIEAQPLERPCERALGFLFAGRLLDPQLGGDEELAARKARLLNRSADGFLILVAGGGVERAVSGFESVADGLLGVLRRDLVDAEAEQRHLDAVVQRDFGDLHRHRPSMQEETYCHCACCGLSS
jgi:hypothetical protein